MTAYGAGRAFTSRSVLNRLCPSIAFLVAASSGVVQQSAQPAWTRRQTAASLSAAKAAAYAQSALAALTGETAADIGGSSGLWVRKSAVQCSNLMLVSSSAGASAVEFDGGAADDAPYMPPQLPSNRRKESCLSYVNARGERQCFSDIDELPTFAGQRDNQTGGFGALGLLSTVTLAGIPPPMQDVPHGAWTMF